MSVNAVAMFYGKLGSDMLLRKAFAEATSACAIRFAAERGYMFTAYDMQVAGETLQGFAKQFGNDLKQLHQHHMETVGKAAGQAAGGAAGRSPSQSGIGAGRAMSTIEMERIVGLLGQIVGSRGSKKKSG